MTALREAPAASLPVEPGADRFCELAAVHAIVPVYTEVVADTLTPVSVYAHLVGDDLGFLLESVEGGERWGRYSFVGRRPLAVLEARGHTVRATGSLEVPDGGGRGVLAALEALLGEHSSPDLPGLPPLHGGVVGFLGYDVVREVEHLPDVPPDDLGQPDASLMVIGQLAAFDHWRQRVVLVDNVPVPRDATRIELLEAYDAAVSRVQGLVADCCAGRPSPPLAVPSEVAPAGATRTMTSQAYRDAVEAAKEYIRCGDIFQVVLSQRFDVELGASPFTVYRALRLLNPSPYLYYVHFDDVTVVGSSPEPMVRLRDGLVTSRPIAGSRPRGGTDEHDRLLAGELIEDPKELAEHVMLVDLARNDVGRVARFRTERVEEFMTVERYSHIMHLTSQVTGELAEGKGPVDVLRATLPAGTLSGAPKVRAMEIIDELEVTKRGIYGGIVGYLDFSGNLDTAIAIRTMVVDGAGRATVQAGAGIVADSDPVSEDEECQNKAAALLAAVSAARAMTQAMTGGGR